MASAPFITGDGLETAIAEISISPTGEGISIPDVKVCVRFIIGNGSDTATQEIWISPTGEEISIPDVRVGDPLGNA
jgi:hypothetical protein